MNRPRIYLAEEEQRALRATAKQRGCRLACPLTVLVLAALACSLGARPAAPDTTQPGPPASPTPTADSAALWYLTRGDVKSDQAWGVDTDSQGNVYIVAYMQQPPTRPFFDMVIYKFSPAGQEIWQTQWGGEFQEKGFIAVVDEPYLYVGGLAHTAMSMTEADMALLALDAGSGEVLWDFSWGQGFGYEETDGLVVDGDYIYLSGWTTSEKTGGDIAVLKLDRNGNLVWAKTWGTEGFDTADGQMVVNDEQLYVSGRIEGENILAGGDAVVVTFSKEDGRYLDHATWGGNAFDDGLGMTSDGEHLYVVGLTLSYGNGGQIFLLKYNRDLNLVWEQIWGGRQGESARAVEIDEDGNVLVAGATASLGSGGDDVLLLRYSPDGNLYWSQTWGGPDREAIHGLALAGDFVYLAGNTDSFSRGQSDALIIKADRLSGIFPIIGDQAP